jgi:hypothetical protein
MLLRYPPWVDHSTSGNETAKNNDLKYFILPLQSEKFIRRHQLMSDRFFCQIQDLGDETRDKARFFDRSILRHVTFRNLLRQTVGHKQSQKGFLNKQIGYSITTTNKLVHPALSKPFFYFVSP